MSSRRLPTVIALLLSCAALPAWSTPCSPDLIRRLGHLYDEMRTASRAGDLARVETLSTPAILAEIRALRPRPDASMLARQIGAFLPPRADATSVRCDASGNKARLIVVTRAVDPAGKSNPVSTVVMFEGSDEAAWRVGAKALTNPFGAQPVEELLRHPALQLR